MAKEHLAQPVTGKKRVGFTSRCFVRTVPVPKPTYPGPEEVLAGSKAPSGVWNTTDHVSPLVTGKGHVEIASSYTVRSRIPRPVHPTTDVSRAPSITPKSMTEDLEPVVTEKRRVTFASRFTVCTNREEEGPGGDVTPHSAPPSTEGEDVEPVTTGTKRVSCANRRAVLTTGLDLTVSAPGGSTRLVHLSA